MQKDISAILQARIIPVVTIEDGDRAIQLADALIAGGLPCAEITFRSDAAPSAIEKMAGYKNMLIGAGTVLKSEQAKVAVDKGARFVFTPGINPKVIEYCLAHNIDVIPGIATPSDIETALDYGLDTVKFFPSEAFGGVKTLRSLCGPYKNIKFIPTGGIAPNNLIQYLSISNVIACGGSWMVKPRLIANGNFDVITELTKAAVKLSKQAQVAK